MRHWTIRGTSFGAALTLILAIPAGTAAQQAEAPATLSLPEAIALARQNNPTFRMTANDATVADWQAREAYGRFIPSLTVSSGLSYQASGTPRFGIFSGADVGLSRTPEYYFSDYSIGLGLSLSGGTIFRAAQARANAGATGARIDAAAWTLAADVTRQYLAALRGKDEVDIAESALESAQEAERLAAVRQAAGAATRIDAAQAEVTRGRAEVTLLQAENLARTERLRLLQQLGVDIERDVELTSEFRVFEPHWTVDELIETSLRANPALLAARADERAANAGSRAAKTAYLPSLRLSAGWTGFVRKTGSDQYLLDQAMGSSESRIENCQFMNAIAAGLSGSELPGYPQDCSKYAWTQAQADAVIASNRLFPFNYEKNPFSASIDISFPILDGFTRERQLQEARVAADDAKYRRRAEEMNRKAEVTTNLLALQTAYQSVQLEDRNASTAAEQLYLAQERYRLGAGSILELAQAQETRVRADQARLAAVYTFHETLAALEAAVGVPLRGQ